MSPRVKPGSNVTSEPTSAGLGTKFPTLFSLESIKGFKVLNEEGESVGKIEDVLFDLNTGKISCYLLSFGGLMGLGNKLFALPYKSVVIDSATQACILHIHLDRLKNAPGLEKGQFPQIHDSEWVKGVFSHYNQVPD